MASKCQQINEQMITIKAKVNCDGGILAKRWETKAQCPNECEITLRVEEIDIDFDKILKTYDTCFKVECVKVEIETKPNDWDITKKHQRCGHCITNDLIKKDEDKKRYEKSLKRRKKNKIFL